MMRSLALPSIFFITLLLLIGLFFFIRASVKDRTEQVTLMAPGAEDVILDQVESYLKQRAYQLVRLNREQAQLTFEGIVRPSIGLAIFLMTLAAVSLLCLSLVLAIQWPAIGIWFTVLVALSPLTVLFYWKKAERAEQVLLKVESGAEPSASESKTLVTVTAHRDELTALKSALKYRPVPTP
ncbi:MAG: cofactor assembly of complex C subunit B [Cyanobacteria bacterium P01_A01_bin.17]